jgi:thioredoxin 1
MTQFLKSKSFNILFFIYLLLVSCNNGTGQSKKTSLTPDEFEKELAKAPDAQLVDVRTPEEYKDGHLKGSKNIDYNDSSFNRKIAALDKSKPIFVYCLSGGRSSAAAQQMRESGFTRVYEMKDGLMKWNAAGKPLVKEETAKPVAETVSVAGFEQTIKNHDLVLADFSATWCRPCRMLSPVLDTLAEKNKGKLLVVRIDVDQNKEITSKMQVTELPTMLVFKNGKQVWRGEGFMTGDMIQEVLDKK